MRVDEWLRMAEARLREAGVDSPRLDAQVLAAHALERDRSWVLAHPEASVPSSDDALLELRQARTPLAYILGWREFYGRRYAVSPAVLIPRQETEVLVEVALRFAPQKASVVDVGTGSGCIAITFKLERPDLRVTASDASVDALAVASANASALGAEVEFVQSDLFSSLSGEFDLIVTNPPYVAEGEALMPEIAAHEPALALYGGATGLEIYERLASEAGRFLKAGGHLAAEIGASQGDAVVALFEGQGWKARELIEDLSGNPRVLVVSR